jgi:hypothetical protein
MQEWLCKNPTKVTLGIFLILGVHIWLLKGLVYVNEFVCLVKQNNTILQKTHDKLNKKSCPVIMSWYNILPCITNLVF